LGFALRVGADDGASRDAQYSDGSRTRGLVGGWGHSWRPIFGQTRSEISFVGFTPRMGWFVAERLEIYGEGTLFVYDRPHAAIAAGPQLAGRYYLKTHGGWIPYVHGGAGLLWTSLDVPEIDRIFNFQLVMGVGWRQNRPSGPCWVFEFRNHHISNAGTGNGKNLGVNAATVLTGIEWVLRPSH
jgi:hypothetical protein